MHKTPINMGRMQFFGNFDGKKEKLLYILLSDLVKKGYF